MMAEATFLPSREIIAESGFFQARAGRVQLTWG